MTRTAKATALAGVIVAFLLTGCGKDAGPLAATTDAAETVLTTTAPPAPTTTATTQDLAPYYEYAAALQSAEEWSAAAYAAQVVTVLIAWHNVELASQYHPIPAPAPPRPKAAAPARPSYTGGGGSNGSFLDCVKKRESGGNYSAYNPSGAAGAYQVMPGTWNHYMGYPSAGQAPPWVQDQFARELYARAGRSPWAGGQYAC